MTDDLARADTNWPSVDLGGELPQRRIDEIHAIIAACQKALRRLAPEIYGRAIRVGTSGVIGHLPK